MKKINEKVILILLSVLLLSNVLLTVNAIRMNNELEQQKQINIEILDMLEDSEYSNDKVNNSNDNNEVGSKDIEKENKKSTGLKVAIDAGHQQNQNSDKEPIGPGASETKMKVASGTEGCETKIPEYQVTLEISKKLEKILKYRGYEVYMVRTENDVNISNKERADLAYQSGADIFVRVHCNSSESSKSNGALTICQTPSNSFVSMYDDSKRLSDDVLLELCSETGAKNNGVMETDTMSGINWSKLPVTIVETGFMSNPEEDRKLSDQSYQEKIAIGISNGIDKYFAK